MDDRLSELQLGYQPPQTHDIEAGITDRQPLVMKYEEGPEEDVLVDFFQETAHVKAQLEVIRSAVAFMKKLTPNILVSVSKSDESHDRFEEENGRALKACADVKKRLDRMGKDIADNESNWPPTEVRIRKTLHQALNRNFVQTMDDYHATQKVHRERLREKMVRQYQIVNPDASKGDIQEVLENGLSRRDNYFATPRQKETQKLLDEIIERHDHIQKLEASISELHQLFVEMQILVESQAELLNKIEENVMKSVSYTERGVKELKQANHYQKMSRKKMCFLMICLLIMLIVALVVVTQLDVL
eukprot:TRINITY_DN11561_c0_g1_i1.p1 TRINITY_DN11561_c0_g1~~TRINITY_DN11561_c0_g1_i1.p1  ORF type:complete len:302 (-),score=79.23 TRINITY_DN11561_c0_g1_i1:196-1101(-)